MEKYYLTKLYNSPIDLERKSKLVEIQYARRPPSFGIIYLVNGEEVDHNQHHHQHHHQQQQTSVLKVELVSLELAENNTARFNITKQVPLGSRISALSGNLVDFDSRKIIPIEDSNETAQAIVLSEFGSLFIVKLNDGSVKSLNCGLDPISEGNFLSCRLNCSDESDTCFAHLLSERCYFLYEISPKFHLLSRYLINLSDVSFSYFTKLLTVDSNPSIAIIELENSNLKTIQDSKCRSTFNMMAPSQQHLIISSGSSDEFILLSFSQTKILAHSMLTDEKRPSDPDHLLVEEPCFEFEFCWSIDLNDIDSIRMLDENDDETLGESKSGEHLNRKGSICAMWSGNQLNPDNSWPKFLIVSYKFHILVYSFEQQPVLPFSVVYDRSFLKFSPASKNPQPGVDYQELSDVKVKPKLLHNFKLIGAQPNDALFNTLLLANGAYLTESYHFAHLGLFIGISSQDDVLAFKFTSSKIVCNKDNLYQQLVAESIRGPSLLKRHIEKMEASNALLRADVTKLETRLSVREPSNPLVNSIDNWLQFDLVPRHGIGCLYTLNHCLSPNVQVSRIIVISTVHSHILKPTGSDIQSVYTDNNREGGKAVLLANINKENLNSIDELLKEQSCDELPIQAWTVLDLDCKLAKKSVINLPMFIMDGQTGFLKVLYVLDSQYQIPTSIQSHLKASGELTPRTTRNSSNGKFHCKVFHIKPLMSYQICDYLIENEHQTSITVSGSFSQKTMSEWLNECFCLKDDANLSKVKLRSEFTHCSVQLELKNNQLSLKSDDLICLDMVKRHILKRATDESIKLDINNSNISVGHLRHLISLQYLNLNISAELLAKMRKVRTSDVSQVEAQSQLLFDSLISEIKSSPLKYETQPPIEWLEESLKNDIESVMQESSDTSFHDKDSESGILRELVCGFIVDALVDYNRSQGVRSSNESMIVMRSKLAQIVNNMELDKNSFLDKIMDEWNSIET